MATTQATIKLTSSDIMDSAINVQYSNDLTIAGASTGITETTGLARRKFASTSKVDLITFDNEVITADKSAKVYIKNTNDDAGTPLSTQYVQILINSQEIGRLYGGDWMFMPYSGGSGEDIEVKPSTTDVVNLEYMVFFE